MTPLTRIVDLWNRLVFEPRPEPPPAHLTLTIGGITWTKPPHGNQGRVIIAPQRTTMTLADMRRLHLGYAGSGLHVGNDVYDHPVIYEITGMDGDTMTLHLRPTQAWSARRG
jgi:hypothetical protein